MGFQRDAVWPAHSARKVTSTKLALVAEKSWWLTISLDCGHDIIREFPFATFTDPRLRAVASDIAKERATRAETLIKSAGACSCTACGSDPA